MATDDQQRREDVRREVLRYMAERNALAFRAETILNKLNREHDFTLAEVQAALEFERGAGRAELLPNDQGKSRFYRVTSQGVLWNENNP